MLPLLLLTIQDLKQQIHLARLWQIKLEQHFMNCTKEIPVCKDSAEMKLSSTASECSLVTSMLAMGVIETQQLQLKQWQDQVFTSNLLRNKKSYVMSVASQVKQLPLIAPHLLQALDRRCKALLWMQRVHRGLAHEFDSMDFKLLAGLAADVRSIPIGGGCSNETEIADGRCLSANKRRTPLAAATKSVVGRLCSDEIHPAQIILARHDRAQKWVKEVEAIFSTQSGCITSFITSLGC
jgi:hypothetical protein